MWLAFGGLRPGSQLAPEACAESRARQTIAAGADVQSCRVTRVKTSAPGARTHTHTSERALGAHYIAHLIRAPPWLRRHRRGLKQPASRRIGMLIRRAAGAAARATFGACESPSGRLESGANEWRRASWLAHGGKVGRPAWCLGGVSLPRCANLAWRTLCAAC